MNRNKSNREGDGEKEAGEGLAKAPLAAARRVGGRCDVANGREVRKGHHVVNSIAVLNLAGRSLGGRVKM
jgi:hypothetical protein